MLISTWILSAQHCHPQYHSRSSPINRYYDLHRQLYLGIPRHLLAPLWSIIYWSLRSVSCPWSHHLLWRRTWPHHTGQQSSWALAQLIRFWKVAALAVPGLVSYPIMRFVFTGTHKVPSCLCTAALTMSPAWDAVLFLLTEQTLLLLLLSPCSDPAPKHPWPSLSPLLSLAFPPYKATPDPSCLSFSFTH